MKTFILVTPKPWHDSLFESLKKREGERWVRIQEKADFTADLLTELQPDKVFIPHWSHIIKSDVFNAFECIVFHMTDLPYGRGGSPLQNLIVRGHGETKVSAIRVIEGIDTGKVYMKGWLSLHGSATEIFIRSARVIETMIEKIIEQSIIPQEQDGEPVVFKRRKPEQSNIADLETLNQVYDYIRMLDCDGYPKAFLETENFRIEFDTASLNADQSINAHVRITNK